ncbi:hypothetical protein [Calothrix sp. PCC 7507]|uniref:hypothetical protein n=1 Tax=Calothrix sp. PCC 7507 TaxID=99598 RepID=UPI00029EF872|nr:hypothetical protein [Calothrix sp. PCC 7507]AFY31819.1 hypothetical protein Cal7507_1352 [Calothrix sp. PCC 7507]
MNVLNNMTDLPLTNIFLIAGIIFTMIAVLGQTKLGFVEINPGCFGRLLALFLGVFSLIFAVFLISSPVETLDLVRIYLSEQIQQSISFFNGLLRSS